MAKQIFVNLSVADLGRSMEFFTALGFAFDPRFTDQNAACLIIDENIYAMLLVEPFFRSFTKKSVADATASTEVILAMGVESRQRVDELVDTALVSGGHPSNDPIDEGFMYGRSFQDPDGHLWEVMYMDLNAVPEPA